jgi:hypothetical protein
VTAPTAQSASARTTASAGSTTAVSAVTLPRSAPRRAGLGRSRRHPRRQPGRQPRRHPGRHPGRRPVRGRTADQKLIENARLMTEVNSLSTVSLVSSL